VVELQRPEADVVEGREGRTVVKASEKVEEGGCDDGGNMDRLRKSMLRRGAEVERRERVSGRRRRADLLGLFEID
jgi:hypothetical protein